MEPRFFVTIFIPHQRPPVRLWEFGLDLFGPSSPAQGELSIRGLLTEASIERLQEAGYRVEVGKEYVEQWRQNEAENRAGRAGDQSPPVAIMDAKEWLEEFYRSKEEQ